MIVLVVIAALLATPLLGGWLLSVIDPRPRATRGVPPPAPRRAFPGLDTAGNRGNLEAAPRRLGNWLFASRSITRAP